MPFGKTKSRRNSGFTGTRSKGNDKNISRQSQV